MLDRQRIIPNPQRRAVLSGMSSVILALQQARDSGRFRPLQATVVVQLARVHGGVPTKATPAQLARFSL